MHNTGTYVSNVLILETMNQEELNMHIATLSKNIETYTAELAHKNDPTFESFNQECKMRYISRYGKLPTNLANYFDFLESHLEILKKALEEAILFISQ